MVDDGSPDVDGWVRMACPASLDHVSTTRRRVNPVPKLTLVEYTEATHAEAVRLLEQGIGHVDDLEREAGVSEVNREYRLSLERKVVELAEQVEALRERESSVAQQVDMAASAICQTETALKLEEAVLAWVDANGIADRHERWFASHSAWSKVEAAIAASRAERADRAAREGAEK